MCSPSTRCKISTAPADDEERGGHTGNAKKPPSAALFRPDHLISILEIGAALRQGLLLDYGLDGDLRRQHIVDWWS